MTGDYEFKKVAEDDPERCGASAGKNQCIMKRCPGSLYCPSHGGNKAVVAAKEKSKFDYRAGKWQARIDEISHAEDIKDLRQEAGVLRLLIEERLNQCNNANELMIHAGAIGDLTTRLTKLVEQISKYDRECGNTLDKAQIVAFAQRFVAIASKYIEDEDARLEFSGEIMGSISDPTEVLQATMLPRKDPIKFDLIEDDDDE
jgi:hypothetical protein